MKWDLEDFLMQMQQVKKMGSMGDLMKKIPGLNKMILQGMEGAEDELKHTEAMILSMTPAERRNPHIVDWGRQRRIARGSGTAAPEVARLLRDYHKIQSMRDGM